MITMHGKTFFIKRLAQTVLLTFKISGINQVNTMHSLYHKTNRHVKTNYYKSCQYDDEPEDISTRSVSF